MRIVEWAYLSALCRQLLEDIGFESANHDSFHEDRLQLAAVLAAFRLNTSHSLFLIGNEETSKANWPIFPSQYL